MPPQPILYDSGVLYDDPNITWDGFMPVGSNNTGMPSDNRISAAISAADKALIITKLNEIRALLPFLVNLTADERKELPKIGDKTLAFDQKCAGYMAARPELVPGFINLTELNKDRVLMSDTDDLLREFNMTVEALSDTFLLAGSEAYMADLAFYQNVRQAAKRGVTGVDAIYDDLRQRFPGRPRTEEPPPTTPTP
jgi:hypothetical protein